ncbi:MAG: hypothetical protein KGI98_15970 [Euryarchaeota archaeon]|nr:hypothetical protein [Euryarchaeota archaeon]
MAGKIELLSRKDIANLSVVGASTEVLDWVIYDTLTIATGGTATQFRFFQQSYGQSGVSLEQTNMEIPGQLAAGYKFVCKRIVATPVVKNDLARASLIDAYNVTHAGRAQFFIGNRPYLQVPMQVLIGGGFGGFAATTVAAESTNYVAPRAVISGSMDYSPVIPATYSFSVLLDYPAAPTLAASVPLRMQLVGLILRPRQG